MGGRDCSRQPVARQRRLKTIPENRPATISMWSMASVQPCETRPTNAGPVEITRDHYDAVLFHRDGVLTPTAKIHAEAWKQMFHDYLRRRPAATGEPFREFDINTDYRLYVDGRPRYE